MSKLFPKNMSNDSGYVVYGEKSENGEVGINENELLNTIKVPQNLAQLTKRLPKANYSNKIVSQSSNLKKRDM